MDIYNFDVISRVFLGQSVSDPDPLDPDNQLLPAFSTTIAPPAEISGFDRVFVDGSWSYISHVQPEPEITTTPVISENLVREEAGRRLESLARPYLPAERETWPKQIKEAEALIFDPAANAPLLSRRAAARGVTPVVYAGIVLAKEEAFSAASGDILAAQDRLLAMNPIPLDFDNDAHWP